MSGESSQAELLESRRAYSGRLLKVDVERVRMPRGAVCELEIIRHPGASAVVPLTDDGDVLLVRQVRHATGGSILEVPAGKLDPGEDPERCAMRETEEETGYRPTTLDPLGWVWTTPGFTDEKIWLFLATGLVAARQDLQADEDLVVQRLPLDRAVALALEGGIDDGKSICALLRARARLRERDRLATPVGGPPVSG